MNWKKDLEVFSKQDSWEISKLKGSVANSLIIPTSVSTLY